MGSFTPIRGSVSWKSRMRCTSAPTPVAAVVHRMGDRTGRKLARFPWNPSDASRAQLGIFPSRDRRSRISQSSPSRPSQITGAGAVAGRGDRAVSSASSIGVTAAAGAPVSRDGPAERAAISVRRQAKIENAARGSAQRSKARLRRMVKRGNYRAAGFEAGAGLPVGDSLSFK